VHQAGTGGAVFLILEMDSHFEGHLRLSDLPLRSALAEMSGSTDAAGL
jgi:hypothetical protein